MWGFFFFFLTLCEQCQHLGTVLNLANSGFLNDRCVVTKSCWHKVGNEFERNGRFLVRLRTACSKQPFREVSVAQFDVVSQVIPKIVWEKGDVSASSDSNLP